MLHGFVIVSANHKRVVFISNANQLKEIFELLIISSFQSNSAWISCSVVFITLG